MPSTITDLMAATIASGLERKQVNTCSRWAEKYRVMGSPFPGPWSFDHHPWLLEMHDSKAQKMIGQKAAQMGYTEWAINIAFFYIDVKGLDVLYILPTASDASDFSSGRFDPALELSPHLRSMFSDVNNVGLKRAGSNVLYVRGSHSRSKLKSIPTPILVFDEIDEMPKDSIALAEERQSGQNETKILQLSTPTIEGHGINVEYKLSSESHFMFSCPSCSRFVELVWPDSFVLTAESLTDPRLKDSHYICTACKNKLPHETKLEWLKHRKRGGSAHFVESHSGRSAEGFHVSQLYSMANACRPEKIAEAALKAELDPTRAQEFHNSKLGLCFESKGARVTDEQIRSAIKGYHSGVETINPSLVRTMGMDVGATNHIVVKEFEIIENLMSINDSATARVLLATETQGNINDFDEAFNIFRQYGCAACVLDAEPERREALRFAHRALGYIYLCDYQYSQQGREVNVKEDDLIIQPNRTAWLDLSLGRFRNGTIAIPSDVPSDYIKHIRALVRIYRQDKYGNPYGVYVAPGDNVRGSTNREISGDRPDHYAHADVYAELALPLGYSRAHNRDIKDFF